jgi:hypothetical protein
MDPCTRPGNGRYMMSPVITVVSVQYAAHTAARQNVRFTPGRAAFALTWCDPPPPSKSRSDQISRNCSCRFRSWLFVAIWTGASNSRGLSGMGGRRSTSRPRLRPCHRTTQPGEPCLCASRPTRRQSGYATPGDHCAEGRPGVSSPPRTPHARGVCRPCQCGEEMRVP